VKVRELQDGAIGTQVFPASRVLLSWLTSASAAPLLRGKTILELGSGCGALALGLVAYGGASRIFASEGEPDVYENLCANVAFNNVSSSVVPCIWDWETMSTPPPEVDLDSVDMIIASDVVYLGSAECELSHALAGLCRPSVAGAAGKKAWLLLADRPTGGEQFLPAAMLDEGVDPSCDLEGQKLSAVGRFLHACARRELRVDEIDMEPSLVEAATQGAKFTGSCECHGRLALYCVQHM